jgi:hypothetical protein
LSNLEREFLERLLSGGLDLDHGSAELIHHPARRHGAADSRPFTQGLHPNWLIAHECFTLLEINPLLGVKRSFRMGVAGWRFAHMKRNVGGRPAIVAVLEELPGICSVVVAASSMITIGIMLYNDWPQ